MARPMMFRDAVEPVSDPRGLRRGRRRRAFGMEGVNTARVGRPRTIPRAIAPPPLPSWMGAADVMDDAMDGRRPPGGPSPMMGAAGAVGAAMPPGGQATRPPGMASEAMERGGVTGRSDVPVGELEATPADVSPQAAGVMAQFEGMPMKTPEARSVGGTAPSPYTAMPMPTKRGLPPIVQGPNMELLNRIRRGEARGPATRMRI